MMGINTREDFSPRMEKTLQERINRKWMDAVTPKDPQTTCISKKAVSIGAEILDHRSQQPLRRTYYRRGKCLIDAAPYLTDAEIGDEVHLRFRLC